MNDLVTAMAEAIEKSMGNARITASGQSIYTPEAQAAYAVVEPVIIELRREAECWKQQEHEVVEDANITIKDLHKQLDLARKKHAALKDAAQAMVDAMGRDGYSNHKREQTRILEEALKTCDALENGGGE